jgi:hypothetical protein
MPVYFLWLGLIVLWWLLARAPGDASEDEKPTDESTRDLGRASRPTVGKPDQG